MMLNLAIKILGSKQALANAVGVDRAAVSQWRRVPAERVLAVAAATNWQVTPHDLRPDLYPNPTDGLPPTVGLDHPKAA